MQYDFDIIHTRTNSNSIKWDFMVEDGVLQQRKVGNDPFSADEPLPMWVADMDFAVPKPVVDALIGCAKKAFLGIQGQPMDILKRLSTGCGGGMVGE